MTTTIESTQLIPVAKIVPSKTNPRKTFNEQAHKELTESVRQVGLLQPILVRPLNGSGRFEIIAGERRYRAVVAAGLTEIAAIPRKATDVEAMALQLIENMLRKDVDAMEEAHGIRRLLGMKKPDGTPAYTHETIAKELGKSLSFVFQRLKLVDLQGAAAEALSTGVIAPSHAILIARLTPDQQEQVMRDYMKPDIDGGVPGEKHLQRYIFEQIMRSLDKAPFKADEVYQVANARAINPLATADDPKKYPPTLGALPACAGCSYRASNNKALFADVDAKQLNTCGLPACYEQKVKLHLSRVHAELQAKTPGAVAITRSTTITHLPKDEQKQLATAVTASNYREVKKNAKGAVPAVVVDGYDRGTVTYVIPQKASVAGKGKTPERRGPSLAERQADLTADINRELRLRLVCSAAASAKVDDYLLTELAVFAMTNGCDYNLRKKLSAKFEGCYTETDVRKVIEGLPNKKLGLLSCIIGGLFARPALSPNWPEGHAAVMAMAKHFGIDVKAMEKKVEADATFAKRIAELKTAASVAKVAAKGPKAAAKGPKAAKGKAAKPNGNGHAKPKAKAKAKAKPLAVVRPLQTPAVSAAKRVH